MGMFDTVFINTDKLPVTQDEKEKIKNKDMNWQTKDLDNSLTEVYITDDGYLKINRFEYETVPPEERPYPNETGLKGLFGSMKRVNEHLEQIDHHGYINFYGDVDNIWYEFSAKFTDGKLENLEKISPNEN